MHITLHDKLLALFDLNVLEPSNEVNAAALAHVDWFHDESLVLLLVELVFQVVCVGWQLPGLWEKIELCSIVLLHFCQVLGQFVFTGETADLREGVDALVGFQLCDFVVLNADVGPPDVPVGILVRKKTYLHLAANTLDHVVVTVLCA
jgi:hypothetical protein